MEKINKSDINNYRYFKEPLLIKDREVFKKILSHLNNLDPSNSTSLSKLWNASSIEIKKREEFTKIDKFTALLSEHIDAESYPEEKAHLNSLKSNLGGVLAHVTLIHIKGSILEVKDAILDILKNIHDHDISHLEKKCRDLPVFFDNIFNLCRLYKKIDETSSLPANKKAAVLRKMCGKLIQSEQIEEAVLVAKSIGGPFQQAHMLRNICRVLVQKEQWEQAAYHAKKIPDEFQRKQALEDISKALSKKEL